MQVAGQPAVNYQYDAAGRLLKISTLNFEHGMLEFSFGYDALGRRTSLTYPNGVTTTYIYDKASRLLSLEHINPLNQILEKISYLYDKNGNRVAIDRLNVQPKLPTPVINATYNSANQMLTFQPEGDIEWSMIYDENGNLTSITNSCGTTTFTWDARNRLIGIEGFDENCNPLSASFKYDALGRRIEKTLNGKTIQYLYDGLDIVQEIENGAVTVNYIRTLNIDEHLARIGADGTIRYYHADALGSIIALTDDLGQVRTQYNYSPFGETELMGEPSDNPFQYTGRENDGTGLYYYRARYYSPVLKRFISEDPIGLMGGDVNLYVYVWNSSINFVDPLGLLTIAIGGSWGGVDFSTIIYDSKYGWWPSQKTDIGVSTTLIGGGVQILWGKSNERCSIYPGAAEVLVSVGLSKYLSYSLTPDLSLKGISLGLGIGTPISASTSIEHFSKVLHNLFSKHSNNNHH